MTDRSNHRLRLTLIGEDEYREAANGLARLRSQREFNAVVQVLEQELVRERELYENQPASEHQRGQVVMLKKVLELLTTGT